MSPIEQRVDSFFLEMIALMAGAFIIVLHWPQFFALFGFGTTPRAFNIELKRAAAPIFYIFAVLSASIPLDISP